MSSSAVFILPFKGRNEVGMGEIPHQNFHKETVMKMFSLFAGLALAIALLPAHAQPRFKPLTYETMNEAQLKAAKDLASGQRGRLNIDGPNALFLRSPELMSRTQRVGEYLR